MRRTTFLVFGIVVLCGVAMVIAGKRYLRHVILDLRTHDCVHVIAMEINVLNQQKFPVPDSEVNSHIAHLIRNSIINAGLDAAGHALDPYGTRFRIDTSAVGLRLITTVVSAGPDQRFATTDDIRYSQESALELRVVPTPK